jgi:tetratricopeptide (TPR) repeat protein
LAKIDGLSTGAAAAFAISLAMGLSAAAPVRADGITDGNAGRQALLEGKTDEAIQLFTHAITFGGLARPNLATTLNLRGRAYLSKGQVEIALDDLNESLRLLDSADARFNRATVYLEQYRFDDAIDDLTKALSLGGDGADIYAERGHAYVYTGQLDLALKDLDEAIKRQPAYGFAFRTRGHAYLNGNQDDKAIADETKAISIDPQDMEAYWLRAYAYRYRKKQLDKAIADYTKALSIDPGDSTNRTSRADAYEQIGAYDLAAQDYDEWIRRNPKGPFGYWARGRLNLIQGKNDLAANDLAKAVSLKPTDPYNVLWLHLARMRTGANDTAELTANAAKLDRTIWPAPVLDYLTGKSSVAQVLAEANKGEGAAKASQMCEALIFLGQDDVLQGRRDDGMNRLQTAQRDCPSDTQEAHLVKADLQRAGVLPKTILASTPATPKSYATLESSTPAPKTKAAPKAAASSLASAASEALPAAPRSYSSLAQDAPPPAPAMPSAPKSYASLGSSSASAPAAAPRPATPTAVSAPKPKPKPVLKQADAGDPLGLRGSIK